MDGIINLNITISAKCRKHEIDTNFAKSVKKKLITRLYANWGPKHTQS